MNEFELIDHFFKSQNARRQDVILGVGDDSALVQVPEGQQLAITTDSLVSGIHFFPDDEPGDIGYKALAVNLSDLAAIGAQPTWVLLNLVLPDAQALWIQKFMQGFSSLLHRYQLELIGGDTCRGPLMINVQALGVVPQGCALRRSGAKSGDKIYVSGYLGDAGLALRMLRDEITIDLTDGQNQMVLQRLRRPSPRVELGLRLRTIANSAIDISDGLVSDLGHILSASQVGARVNLKQLPLSSALKRLPEQQAYQLALSSGDDYELCFTVPKEHAQQLQAALIESSCFCTEIGEITAQPGLILMDERASHLSLEQFAGFEHF
jgi:thiamine-monophosphate kinase